MHPRRLLTVGLGLVLVVLLASANAVFAGGWAVITLDREPVNVQPNVPFTIGVMVRQHGQTPLDGLHPQITLTRSDSGDTINLVATPEGAVGHYTATITLPSAGKWNWTIDAFYPPLVLTPIDVRLPPPAPAPRPAETRLPTEAILGALGVLVVILLGGGVVIRRRRTEAAV